jgi:hypothetical protein
VWAAFQHALALGNVVFPRPLLRSNTHLMLFCAIAFSLSNDDKSVIHCVRVMNWKGDVIRALGMLKTAESAFVSRNR